MTCPACDADATGRFCPECGVTLSDEECRSCKARIPAGVRFCQLCGQPVGKGPRRTVALSWIVSGSVVAALAVLLLVRLTSPSSAIAGAPASVPDISTMSPRERADRLFNRVMAAVGQGDTAQVNFFIPMALQSYAMIGELDPDARYHLGLLHFIGRDFSATLAQADSIAAAIPGHLLAGVLRIQVTGIQGDVAGRKRAYQEFLDAYDREMASGRNEYIDHTNILQRTRDDARKTLGRPR